MVSGIFHAMLSGFVFNFKKLRKIEYVISSLFCIVIIIFNSIALNKLLTHSHKTTDDDGLLNLN